MNENIHWPSLFWFIVAAVSFIGFLSSPQISALFKVVSFLLFGYSSIALVPKNLFTLSLSTGFASTSQPSKLDLALQLLAFALLFLSFVV